MVVHDLPVADRLAMFETPTEFVVGLKDKRQ
jgi:hypothetical protein